MKMRWTILFAILAIMILAGCAQKPAVEDKTPVTPTAPEQPAQEEVVAPEQPAAEDTTPEKPKPTTETVLLSDSAAEPATLKVAAGSTIVFKNTGTKVKLLQVKTVEFNERSPRMAEGDTFEITLNKAGEYQFLDIIIGKVKGTITVE